MTSRGMNSSSRIYNLILSRAFQTVVVTLGAESHKIISQGWVGPIKPSHKMLQNAGLVHPSEIFSVWRVLRYHFYDELVLGQAGMGRVFF